MIGSMDLGIEGAVAMVAAASKGIGFAVAKTLAEEGCRVSICSRGERSLLDAQAQLPGSRAHLCDVHDAGSIESWFEATRGELGEPDILVTNSGGPPAGPVFELEDEQWQTGFEGTVLSVVRMTRHAAPAMKAKGWGRIVHITSLVAKEPSLVLPISSTLRAGLGALTRIQATELGPFGVTVNAVLPGHTLTDRQRELLALRAAREGLSEEQALAAQAAAAPVRRLGSPSEIAAAIAFLCSRHAGFVTGECLLVDGGLTKGIA
jgi:3-oxoacyl-[acyl-carrier protein] reductase